MIFWEERSFQVNSRTIMEDFSSKQKRLLQLLLRSMMFQSFLRNFGSLACLCYIPSSVSYDEVATLPFGLTASYMGLYNRNPLDLHLYLQSAWESTPESLFLSSADPVPLARMEGRHWLLSKKEFTCSIKFLAIQLAVPFDRKLIPVNNFVVTLYPGQWN